MVEHVNTIGRRSVFSCLWSPTKSPNLKKTIKPLWAHV